MTVARTTATVTDARIMAAQPSIRLVFDDASVLHVRPESLFLAAPSRCGDAGAAALSAERLAGHLDLEPVPPRPWADARRRSHGTILAATPEQARNILEWRAGRCILLALSEATDPPDTLRDLFERATGLPADAVPILSLHGKPVPGGARPFLVVTSAGVRVLLSDAAGKRILFNDLSAVDPAMPCILPGARNTNLGGLLAFLEKNAPRPTPQDVETRESPELHDPRDEDDSPTPDF